MSRQLIKREGLLCGGSCGSATYCAIQKFNMQVGQNFVVILPDSIKNYMTRYLSDVWMIARGFIEIERLDRDPWWFHQTISNLKESVTILANNIVDEDSTLADGLRIMKENSIDCLIIFIQG